MRQGDAGSEGSLLSTSYTHGLRPCDGAKPFRRAPFYEAGGRD